MAQIRNVAFFGDSIVQGTSEGCDFSAGGKGNLCERLAQALMSRHAGILGWGYRGIWRGGRDTTDSAWAETPTETNWFTQVYWGLPARTDASARAPWNEAMYPKATGTGYYLTWTRENHIPAGGGFSIYWIDRPTDGNWQYRVDAGAWTNMGQTRLGDNKLKKFYVSTAVTSTVTIRAYDGSAGCTMCIAGIEPYCRNPNSNDGIIVHDLGRDGYGLWLHGCHPDQTYWDAWFNDTTLAASTPSHSPDTVLLMVSNDVYWNDSGTGFGGQGITSWEEALHEFWGTVGPGRRCFHINVFEQGGDRLNGVQSTASEQAAYRNAVKQIAPLYGVTVIDIYDLWAHDYGYGYQAAVEAGVMGDDALHPSQAGIDNIARRIMTGG